MYQFFVYIVRSVLAAAALCVPNPGGVLLAPVISLYFLTTVHVMGVCLGVVSLAAAALVSHRMGLQRNAVRQMAKTFAGSEARSRCKCIEAQHWAQTESQRWRACALLWQFSPSLATQSGERTLQSAVQCAWKSELLSTWETLLHWHACALTVYSQVSTAFLRRRDLEQRLAQTMANATGTPVEEIGEEVDWILALGKLPLTCSVADALGAIQKGLFAALAGLEGWEGLVQGIGDDTNAARDDPLVRACGHARTFRELRRAMAALVSARRMPQDAWLSYVRDVLMFPAAEAEAVVRRFPPPTNVSDALSLRRVIVQINILRATKAKTK